eukprot:TRINITY_DN709_c0_g1_i3.p1 TRINITY_DN709_c0_g1~~TRINITY_DN709_c0_g1_i3.p1  ORF type:complete len:4344 (-),score=1082.54 TRINITY_DN709_c0_g1_i3:153-13184(-)
MAQETSASAFESWVKQHALEKAAVAEQPEATQLTSVSLGEHAEIRVPHEIVAVTTSIWERYTRAFPTATSDERTHESDAWTWLHFVSAVVRISRSPSSFSSTSGAASISSFAPESTAEWDSILGAAGSDNSPSSTSATSTTTSSSSASAASSAGAVEVTAATRVFLLRTGLDEVRRTLHQTERALHVLTKTRVDGLRLLRDYMHAATKLALCDGGASTSSAADLDPDLDLARIVGEHVKVDGNNAALPPLGSSAAVFGGQGASWLQELRMLYATYPFVRGFVDSCASMLKGLTTHSAVVETPLADHYRHGLDLLRWIRDPSSVPFAEYLAAAPVSYPLVGLTQLAHYAATLALLGLDPVKAISSQPVSSKDASLQADVAAAKIALVRAATGHSQGIMAAVVAGSVAAYAARKDLDAWAAFAELAKRCVATLFWIGARVQAGTPFSASVSATRSDIVRESESNGDRRPTPMLAVLHIAPAVLDAYVSRINKTLAADAARHLQLSLRNGPRAHVVCGHPESLHMLAVLLRQKEAPMNVEIDQSRIPFSKRKKPFALKYLDVSAPFHATSLLAQVPAAIMEDLTREGIVFDNKDLTIPVYSTKDGSDLRSATDLTSSLVNLQVVEPVDFVKCTSAITAEAGFTHIIDFGPGEASGAGSILARNLEGAGLQIILAGSFNPGSRPIVSDKSALFEKRKENLPTAPNWSVEYQPRLVKRAVDGKIVLDTKFTRLVGKPPIMVAGMTPTTVHPPLIAAVLNAGYHGELAGGGLPTERMFRDHVQAVLDDAEAGNGVSLNLLFLNARLWGLQYPLIKKMRAEGVPIEGLTCAAGVPSLDNATEIITSLNESGLRHVSFKPGSIQAIHDVIKIAAASPEISIILQWTGGRGGGHHSFEDFHEPMLQTYAAIRQQKNIVLVAGSGFGDAEGSWPYMSGAWSTQYGYPPMPFDGILVASRVMVAKEAATADEVKDLLVQTPGVKTDAEWELSYDSVAGGIITVMSELGEPIHKVGTRGLLFWREMDKDIFAQPKEKQATLIASKKDYIIKRLNADFQKVYFGKRRSGAVVDLSEMTYEDVLYRMVQIMYIRNTKLGSNVWIHSDFKDRVYVFAQRMEERFAGEVFLSDWKEKEFSVDDEGEGAFKKPVVSSKLPAKSLLDSDPLAFLESAFKTYPKATKQLLSSEDVDYFVELCKMPAMKPVNFVPVIDSELSFWLKKDSLWYSECLDAVPDRDVGRVCILQGPLAVRYSVKANEPVGSILDGIHQGFIDKLQADLQQKGVTDVQVVEYLGASSLNVVSNDDLSKACQGHVTITVKSDEKAETTRVVLPDNEAYLPDSNVWADWLAGTTDSWWRALLTSHSFVYGKSHKENLLRHVFRARAGLVIDLSHAPGSQGKKLQRVQIYDQHSTDPSQPSLQVAFEETKSGQYAGTIVVTMYHHRPAIGDRPARLIPLALTYGYNPRQGYAPIHAEMSHWNQQVKEFYAQLWFGDEDSKSVFDASPIDVVFKSEFLVKKDDVDAFARSTGITTKTQDGKVVAPMDFAIVIAWEPLIKSLFPKSIDGDILQLVHLSNGFSVVASDPKKANVFVGDKLTVEMRIVEIVNSTTEFLGKRVSVVGQISRGNEKAFLEVKSQFLFRGAFSDYVNSFRRVSESRKLVIDKKEKLEILLSKSWFKWTEGETKKLSIGDVLIVETETVEFFQKDNISLSKLVVAGRVHKYESLATETKVLVANVEYKAENVQGNALKSYLLREGEPVKPAVFLRTGGYSIPSKSDVVTSPATNHAYAVASRDLNPIHTNPFIADLARLPATITHGMWTSANARRVVEIYAARNHAERVLSYNVEFSDMVKPGDTLFTRLKHVGTREGKMILEVATKNQNGSTVLKGSAEVVAPLTAYVFTGQGSAEVGMGMDLYASSPAAAEVWNRADKFFVSFYGISLLQIVKQNPKEITIHFGGTQGEQIRRNYQGLTQQVLVKRGEEMVMEARSLFPDIKDETPSYTFRYPDGLLFATQFTQPSLTILEYAAFQDMRDKGLVSDDSLFAGHSLGEYAGLSSVGDVLSVEDLVGICFLRGMTMQNAVIRNENGRSQYAMVAANPSRVHPRFSEEMLKRVVEAISKDSGELLQVVNYNIVGYQYVVAGELTALYSLESVLSQIRQSNALPKVAEMVPEFIQKAIAEAKEKKAAAPDGLIRLERGQVTIPLPGIDVPFHSRFLESGVPPFREILRRTIQKDRINLRRLVGKYIPNLTARPFQITKEYVQMTFEQTNSPSLRELLEKWDVEAAKDDLLVAQVLMTELLSYQFASPVRWIETQDVFFREFNIERMIEVGPAPTLYTMAKRTLEIGGFSPFVTRELYWYNRDKTSIYYEQADEEEEESTSASQPESASASTPAPAQTPAPVAVAAPAPVVVVAAAVSSAPAAAVPDAPVTALEFFQTLLALRLKKPYADIAPTSTIKSLVGGKSALQNELIGDIEKEFGGSVPEGAADASISALAQQMGRNYSQLGKVSSNLVHKLISSKMPGSFSMSKVKSYLSSTYGFGEGRTQGLLLHSLAHEPAARQGSEADAQSWLDSMVQSYGTRIGQSFAKGGSSAGGSSGAAPSAAMSVAVAAAPRGGSGAGIPEAPVSALDFLKVLLALKLKKPLSAIDASATIKQLVGGKSALQNELVGDISKEFGAEPEGAAEMNLQQLAGAVGAKYTKLGKLSSGLVSKLFSGKMSSGFSLSAAKSHLAQQHGLKEGRIDSVLLFSLSMEPAARLGSDDASRAWLDSVLSAYAAANGLSLSGDSGAGAVSSAPVAYANPAAVDALKQKQESLIRETMKAYYEFLGEEPLAAERAQKLEASLRSESEKALGLWVKEHGEYYADGIKPAFDSNKERSYDSFWNWTRQDVLTLYYDGCTGTRRWGNDIRERLYHVKNRSIPQLVDMVEYYIHKSKKDGHGDLADFASILANTVRSVMHELPKYRVHATPLGPSIVLTEDGALNYKEVQRRGIKSFSDYVNDLRAKAFDPPKESDQLTTDELSLIEGALQNSTLDPAVGAALREKLISMVQKVAQVPAKVEEPKICLRSPSAEDGSHRVYDATLSRLYLDTMAKVAEYGVTFHGKVALVTGCGKGSIGIEIVKGLLMGGATVIATTSRFSRKGADFYRSVFDNHGAKNSRLIVVPFNQGSLQDVNALVNHIYDPKKGLDIDYIVPFAAIPENGNDISSIDGKSELAHRIMLTNTVRLLGAVRAKKQELGISTRPAHVLLPLSPNHGIFGFDGLYAESKMGLEALLNKWKSEGWSNYLSLVGAVIGWTRGTGLMSANNMVAPGIEDAGVRTFSTAEMCFNLVCLMHPSLVSVAQTQPIWADLTGGLHKVHDLNGLTTSIRQKLLQQAATKKAIARDRSLDQDSESSSAGKTGAPTRFGPVQGLASITPRANISVPFPSLPSEERRSRLAHLKGSADLEKIVVVTGFGEIGPWGNARTRWEMEAKGEFSLEGCIELAWMLGLIKYAKVAGNKSGWVDAKTNEPVHDWEVKAKYEETIMKHSGIRLVEPELFDGYDPHKKMFLHQVALNHAMDPLEVSQEEAVNFQRQHGDAVDVFERSGVWYIQLKKGGVLYIPKALKFDRFVAGQIPTGWNPAIFGIPEDIINQVDPVTLYTLVSMAEALISAGISDPYEFYEYVHVSELGNTIGGGFGGMKNMRDTYRNRFLDKPVKGDTLQETFINTVPAWINMLLLSGSGPIKTPVGACATAVESVEIGFDTITTGRAKICVVGGYDDFGEEGSYEFAQMKATSNSVSEIAAGREPSEMSRPTTDTRAGFMEAQGAGVQILMNAATAIAMGVPIYGIVAHVSTATDKEGRSVPAPGTGILTTAREVKTRFGTPMLNFDYRMKQLKRELARVQVWDSDEKQSMEDELKELIESEQVAQADAEEWKKERLAVIERETIQLKKRAYSVWSNDFFRNDPTVAPLRGALAVFGLTVDDIAVASFHGTSTKANDKNECYVLQRQLEHLGRSKGNVMLSIFQKYLTGHPKGAAGSWMFNGLVQSMLSGIVPGNRNADNIDPELRKYDHVVFLNRSLQTYGYEAGVLKSFGFGQVGSEVLIIHPDYVLAQLDEDAYAGYIKRRDRRAEIAYRHLQAALTGKGKFVRVQNEPPYAADTEASIYLDPSVRASFDTKKGSWRFKGDGSAASKKYTSAPMVDDEPATSASSQPSRTPKAAASSSAPMPRVASSTNLAVTLREMAEKQRMPSDKGIGVDTQSISDLDVSIANDEFVRRNFTSGEISYCRASKDPSSSFAGRWAAKEAVVKAMSNTDMNRKSTNLWRGGGAPLKDIEIVPSPSGAPVVVLHGYALEVATALGITDVKVTISHSGDYAVAQAVAR